MFTEKDIEEVEAELKRFNKRIVQLKKRISEYKEFWCYGCSETAALKRASLDLSKALIVLRK